MSYKNSRLFRVSELLYVSLSRLFCTITIALCVSKMFLSMSFQAGLPVFTAVTLSLLAVTCTFFAKLYMRRMKFVKLRKLGLVSDF
jgi:hypothetical protein